MMTSTPLVQDPRPTLVGERVNSQGSRKAKELLLADDYDGLTVVAEDQVTGGAHVLDLCVALTERQDEDEQMRILAKKVSLTQPAPISLRYAVHVSRASPISAGLPTNCLFHVSA